MAIAKLKRGVRRTKRTVGAEVRWRGIIADLVSSGKSVPAFCAERGISKEMLYTWRKRLKAVDDDSGVAVSKLVSVKVKSSVTASAPQDWGIEVTFPSGHTIRIAHGIDAGVITAVLATMRAVAC